MTEMGPVQEDDWRDDDETGGLDEVAAHDLGRLLLRDLGAAQDHPDPLRHGRAVQPLPDRLQEGFQGQDPLGFTHGY